MTSSFDAIYVWATFALALFWPLLGLLSQAVRLKTLLGIVVLGFLGMIVQSHSLPGRVIELVVWGLCYLAYGVYLARSQYKDGK